MSSTRPLVVVLAAALGGLALGQQPDAPGTARLCGRIVTLCHDGVPAAAVWVTDAEGRELGRTVADGDGYYQLNRLPLTAHWLCAEAPGRCTGRLPIAQPGRVRTATLALEDGDALRGVLTLPDGNPAANAAVLVEPTFRLGEPFDWFAETTTDATGAWSLPAVPLRARTMRAYLPERALLVSEIAADHTGPVKAAFAAERVEPRRVTVQGAPAGAVVTVVNDIGLPRRADTQRWPAAALTTTCDATGTATLPVLPVPHEVRASAAGQRSMPVSVPCDPGDARALTFTMTPRQSSAATPVTEVRGALVDHVGAPLAAMPLVTRIDDVYATVTTGADGTFVCTVPAKPGVLFAIAVHDPKWRLGGERAHLQADGLVWTSRRAGTEDVQLQATPAAALRDTLRRPDGGPLAAAAVTLLLLAPGSDSGSLTVQAASDAAGRVDLGGLPSGRYRLTATNTAWSGSTELQLAAGATAKVGALQFDEVGEIVGTVRDPGGRGAPGQTIVAIAEKGRNRGGLAVAQGAVRVGDPGLVLTDRNGRFRIPGLAAGTWRVSIPGTPRGRFVSVTVEKDQRAEVDLASPR